MCWDTIFNGIGAISTLGAAIAAGVAAYKLHMQTKEVSDTQTKLSIENINIMLFERRYNIFESFSKLYELKNYIGTANSNVELPDRTTITGKEMLSVLIFDNFYEEDRKILKEKIRVLTEKLKTTDNKKQERVKNEIAMTQQELFFNEIKVAKSITSEIKMSKYCFPENISDAMYQYTDLIFKLALPIGTLDQTTEQVVDKLKIIIDKIEEENIIEQIEEYLDISFEESKTINK